MLRVVLTLALNAAASPVITIAPISAVPSELPSCWAVYWRPPASLRSSSSTADCTTLPSCETTSPIPTPSTAIAIAKSSVSICGSIVPSRNAVAASRKRKPARTIVRGEKRDGEPRAEQRRDEQRDRGRQHAHARLQRVESLHDLQVERDREEDPHQHEVLAEERR